MEEDKSYSIVVNKKIYRFCCNDGEEHVKELKSKLMCVVDSLSINDSGHILSDYAMKIAILLADEAVRAETGLKKQEEELEKRLPLMLEKLDSVLSDIS